MIRYCTQTMLRCIKRWKSSLRMILLFAMIACIILMYALPFVENARVQGEKLQVCEVFIAICNWRFSMLIFSCSIIILFCDLPIVDRLTTNALIKGSRRTWYVGQAMYVIATSMLCALALLVLSILVSLPRIDFSNAWSRPVKLVALGGKAAIDPERMKLGLSKDTLTMGAPYRAAIHSFFLLFLLNCFHGLCSLDMSMFTKTGSFIALFVFNAVSWAASMFGSGETGYAIFSMLSPNYHASYSAHANVAKNHLLPTLTQSYIIMIVAVILLLLFGLLAVKKFDFILHEEVTE